MHLRNLLFFERLNSDCVTFEQRLVKLVGCFSPFEV
jgi:hypothetical protein